MRPFELTLTIFTVIGSMLYFFPKASGRLKYQVTPLALIVAIAAQIVLEGFRWQLWPLYAALLLILLASGRALLTGKPQGRSVGLASTGLVLALLSLVLGWLAPIPKPYPISGPYQVGTIIFPLKDTSRAEIYADDPNARREIMLQIWYPASPTKENQQALWMPDVESAAPAIADWIGLPPFTLSHLKYVKANAFIDAPVVSGSQKFPLLVFSHGWSGFKEQNIYQVEELASHGYVVAAPNHTYGAVLTTFPDGRQMPRNDSALPEGVTQEEYDRASNRLVRQWAADIGFVLDELARRDQAGGDWPLSGRLDFNRVGVFGHSTGGGATAEFCATDARCKAALMMDLWVEPVSSSVVSAGISQPFLLMHSAAWSDTTEPNRNFSQIGELVEASSGDVTEFIIAETMHHDFTSLPLLTPLAGNIGLRGTIPGERVLDLINDYTLAFFNQYLLGMDQGLLLPENAPYSEAQFISRP
ncbi:MAG: hypothetical protein P8Y68_07865 [Anaerolineales bacterium]